MGNNPYLIDSSDDAPNNGIAPHGDHWVIYHLPTDFYGNSGFDSYHFNRPIDGANHWDYYVSPVPDAVMDDAIHGSDNRSDFLFGGWGDDDLLGRGEPDILVGGDGSDTITGGHGSDAIYGDWTNMPSVNVRDPRADDEIQAKTEWLAPPYNPYLTDGSFITCDDGDNRNQDLSLTGDDVIYGGRGSDLIVAGPGNDQISAGPHGISGDPYTDDVSGGPGRDAFLLQYDGDGSEGGAYWSSLSGSDIAGSAANAMVKSAVNTLGKAALNAAEAETALTSTSSAMLFGPLGAVGGALAAAGIEYLLDMGKAETLKTNEDVLVIRDFNPSEDALFLPMEDGVSLIATPTFYANSPVTGLNISGWAISITNGNDGAVFTEVFLDPDYFAAINISGGSSALAVTALDNVLSTGVTIDSDGYVVSASQPDALDPFGDVDPAPPAYTAQEGTFTHVWGAYSAVSIVQPAASNGIHVGGTVWGDLLTANAVAFLPEVYDTYRNDGLNSVTQTAAYIRGFDGDDLIYGGAASDALFGDEGDDLIYSFEGATNSGGSIPESLSGGEGHDRLYGLSGTQIFDGGPGSDVMDGGAGEDTATYADAAQGVRVDLGTGYGYDGPTAVQVIGEYGGVSVSDEPVTVSLGRSYVDPVVILSPPGWAGEDLGVARITEVTSDSFTVYIQEAAYDDGAHRFEDLDYIVVERGAWELGDGTILAAGEVATNQVAWDDFSTIVYSTLFDEAPAVVSQLQSEVDSSTMAATRQRALTNGDFDVGIQMTQINKERDSAESVGYLAVEQGVGTTDGIGFEAFVTGEDYASNWKTLDFEGDYSDLGAAAARFFGTVSTREGADPVFLRRDNATSDGIDVLLQEDTSQDSETSHGTEALSYISLGGRDGVLTGIVAPDRLFDIENLIGSAHDDHLAGDEGDNELTGGDGDDVFVATYGDDTITDFAAGDVIDLSQDWTAYESFDELEISGPVSTGNGFVYSISLAAGSDVSTLSVMTAPQYNWTAADFVFIEPGATLIGEEDEHDLIVAGNSDNSVYGLGGHDTLSGGGGADSLYGGRGDDTLYGGRGDDTLHGGRGDDVIRGGRRDDMLDGGRRDDTLYGGRGDDVLHGGRGDDALYGGRGDDTLFGGRRDDTLYGGGRSRSVHLRKGRR
ncbi:calcium-binding protein [Sedimentitalea sp. JM2-8]|uniref:Calcium-binding protein n=1 Tax=Sedimentitalea xiamensis TaxID=3050037 RepID=A0ABT7FF09_9RHOB|nr:calcium-binding protein [Sedimentitalea xiamensis]MDK3073565.1 calcium-binding protein [Sedimentitalea xiamensis]